MTQLYKHDFPDEWYPQVLSQQSVTGDCSAQATVLATNQGVAFGLTTTNTAVTQTDMTCGVEVTLPYERIYFQGKCVAANYIDYVDATYTIQRVGSTWTVKRDGTTIYTVAGPTSRVWMVATLYASGGYLPDATLTGTYDPPGAGTVSASFKPLAGRGAVGNKSEIRASLAPMTLIALSGKALREPMASASFQLMTLSAHVLGYETGEATGVVDLLTDMTAEVVPGGWMDHVIGVTSTMSGTITFSADMRETLTILSTMASGGTVEALMYSTLTASDRNDYAGAYALTWAVNAETGASSMYEGYDINSMAKWGDSYIGARNDGIYLLQGSDDAGEPIRASMAFGAKTFGTLQQKTVQYAYLGVAAGGGLYARITVDDKTYTYKVRRSNDNLQTQRIDMGRGLKATHVVLELLNEDGADFELSDIQFNIAVLARRI